MPYRNELHVLCARRDALRASLREPRSEDEVRAIERELEPIAARIRELDPGARALLDRVRIATRCDASWDAMQGDDRARHCGACNKKVYDLSALTRIEAEALLAASGEPPCVRLHRRRDGTILTADCTRDRRRRFRHVAVAAALAAGAVTLVIEALAPSARTKCATRLASARPAAAVARASENNVALEPESSVALDPDMFPLSTFVGIMGVAPPFEPAAMPRVDSQGEDGWLFRRQ